MSSASISASSCAARVDGPPRSSPRLDKPDTPPVALIHKIYFFVWVLRVALNQAWRDLKMWRWYQPLHSADSAVHYFFVPIGRQHPRMVLSAPHDRMLVRTIPDSVTRDYEELDDLSDCPVREIVNAASNNYGGFTRYEHDSASLIETALQYLPFNPAPADLEARVRKDLAAFMSAEACVTTLAGFGANILAFRTVAQVAKKMGKRCYIVMDRDSHSSMFVGAYMNGEATFHKFKHNDVSDLEYRLRLLRKNDPSAFVCVALEGVYSMEGALSPLPAILALRRIFGFCLFVDEAHGFMATGHLGCGSSQWWQDNGYDCPLSQVDILTATLSKSVGALGGFVTANGIFAPELNRQEAKMRENGAETLSTVALVRVWSLISKPLFIKERMKVLRIKSSFVWQSLTQAGCKMMSPPGSSIVCFPVGTIQQASNFHAEALARGFAVAVGVPPATPLWACRVRMCIPATISWDDVLDLTNMVIAVCCKLGLHGVRPMTFNKDSLPTEETPSQDVAEQSQRSDAVIKKYIIELGRNENSGPVPLDPIQIAVRQTAIQAFRRYGFGPCSARWFYGSFDIFIALERRLAKLYPSLELHSGRCRGMICSDSQIMLSCLLSTCASPMSTKGDVNLVLVPHTAPEAVKSGVSLNLSKQSVQVIFYDKVDDLTELLRSSLATSKPQSFHVTVYLQTRTRNGDVLQLGSRVNKITSLLRKHQVRGLTLLLDDTFGLGKIGPRRLGYFDLMESQHGLSFISQQLGRSMAAKTTIAISGCWYDAFGHQGGYVISSAAFIEALTVHSKVFVFSTPPSPVQAAMSDKTLELLAATKPSKFSKEGRDKDGILRSQGLGSTEPGFSTEFGYSDAEYDERSGKLMAGNGQTEKANL